MIREIHTPRDLMDTVHYFGLIPFFSSPLPGFSLDAFIPDEVWAENQGLGPWMWRDEIAEEKTCIYGKFLRGKTAYVAAEWFPALCNYRRDGYDCDARYEDGLLRHDDWTLYELIEKHGPITAPCLKSLAGVTKETANRFEASLTRLQMLTYVVPSGFTFPRKPDGSKRYSYGVTWYDTPEHWLGPEAARGEYGAAPEHSLEKLCELLAARMPDVSAAEFSGFIKL